MSHQSLMKDLLPRYKTFIHLHQFYTLVHNTNIKLCLLLCVYLIHAGIFVF